MNRLFHCLSAVLVLSTVGTAGPQVYAASKVRCESNLTTPSSIIVSLVDKFSLGLDDDRATVGYIGISQETMNQLFKAGAVNGWMDREELEIHITGEHRTPARLISLLRLWRSKDWDRETAIKRASRDATLRSTVALIQARILQHGVFEQSNAEPYLFKVLEELEKFDIRNRNKNVYSVSFRELEMAIYTTDIPFQEPTTASEATVTMNKLGTLVRALGYSAVGLNVPGSEAQMQLTSLFANLPRKAGYVLGAKTGLISNAKELPLKILKFRLADISGIEPIGEPEFSFMESLQRLK